MLEEDFIIAVGKRIAEIRKSKGISQFDLASKCNMEKPNISRIENGSAPTIRTLHKIATALETTVSEITKVD